MKVTVFTSNQPRHLSLVEHLAQLADEVFAVVETNTVFPGQIADFFAKSPPMQEYFNNVMDAERHFFGEVRFSSNHVRVMTIRSGDLNLLSRSVLAECLESDAYVVFGSSFIKGWLVDFLVERKALNIHMGVSPYYRGSSCNFWALFDGNPGMVGATIHLLTKGLDSGPIVRHAMPTHVGEDPFRFTMKAVVAAQQALVSTLAEGTWESALPVAQDPRLEIRYSRNADFTDPVVEEFRRRELTTDAIGRMFSQSARPELVAPFLL